MFSKLKPKSEFTRNVLTLMTGTTIAQAIPIAISPILTRIYTPEDFGILSLYSAAVAIIGSISSMNYEYAIMLPKKDEDAINLFALGFVITTFISLFMLLLIVFFHNYFVELLNNKEISVWLYLMPLSVFLIGLLNLLTYFNNRKKQYKDLASATVVKSLALSVLQVGIGVIKSGASGLIIGQIFSNMFGNIKLLQNILNKKTLLAKIDKEKMILLAKRYKDFPKFSVWATLTNTASFQVTNIFISALFSVATLGFYSLVQRVLGMPSALIGRSIGQVFFQEAAQERQNSGKAHKAFNSTIKKLILIGILIFGFLFFTVEDIFTFVFGQKWQIAGEYAKILMPLFFIRFISSTVSVINTVFEKNRNGLYINILLLLTALSVIWFAHIANLPPKKFFELFSFVMSIEYLLFLFYYYKLARGDYEKNID